MPPHHHHHSVVAIEKGAFGSPSIKVANSTFYFYGYDLNFLFHIIQVRQRIFGFFLTEVSQCKEIFSVTFEKHYYTLARRKKKEKEKKKLLWLWLQFETVSQIYEELCFLLF